MDEIGKTVLCIKLTPTEDGRVEDEMHVEGQVGDLLAAYVALSKQLFDTVARDTAPGFAAEVYAKSQELILSECSFAGNVKMIKMKEDEAKRVMPLLNILGKTFHVGGDE